MPKISLIVPVYKVEKYLPECLNSIINQTFQDWQAICIDDGSPDNCGKILDEYAKKDNRIKVIHQSNKGLSEARNAAYPYIDTPYTMFLDSDDFLHSKALEVAYNNIEKTNADMLWFDSVPFIDGEKVIPHKIQDNFEIKSYKNPLKFYAIKNKLLTSRKTRMSGIVWNKIYKSEYVKQTPFAPGIAPNEDNLFTLELLTKINSLVHLKEKLCFHRYRQGSIMRSLEDEKLKENLRKEINWYNQVRTRIIQQNIISENMNIFDKYLVENVFFKKLFRPFIKGKKNSQDQEYINGLIQSDMFDFKKMRFKYRLIMFLYLHKQKILTRMLCYL